MELSVGMYVRTKDKKGITYIRKLTKLANDYPQKLYGMEVDDEIHYVNYLSQKNILKASHTLLGNEEEPCLIEVGDYVNGYKVSFIGNDYKPFVQCDYPVQEETTNHYRFYEEAIYSIVTKEQFLQMEYKVGE